MIQDLKLAFKSFVRRPPFRAVAVAILALGLAAAISVFTYTNAFHQPFPGADPHGLVQLFGSDAENPFLDISFLDFQDYAATARSFQGMAATQPYYAASVRHEDMTEVAFVEAVTREYFSVLGAEVSLGRPLAPEDDQLESEPAAVISYEWWQSRWSGRSEALGSTVYLNYRPFTIVGVASRDFVGSTSDFRPHVWIPIAHFRDRYTGWDRLAQNRDLPLVRVYGRLAEGQTEAQSQAELQRLAEGLDQAYPPQGSLRRVLLEPATWIDPRARVAESSRNRIVILGAAGFLFLVCANVANLLLSAFSGRKKELALQAAIGASPGRLLRGILAENLVLALLAGSLGLGLALPVSARMGSYFARPSVWGANVSREFSLDLKVFAFAILVSAITGLLAGAFPAFRAMSKDLLEALKSDAGARAGPRRVFGVRLPGVRDLLLSTQVALSAVLLVVSALVLKTLNNVEAEDPGFDYAQLIGSHISTSSTGVQVEEREAFFRELEERIAREPWVVSATFSANAPLSGHGSVEARSNGQEEPVSSVVAIVHDGFFEKLGIRLLEGRGFAPFDTAGVRPVVVLNRPAAALYFRDEPAVGSTLWLTGAGGDEQAYEVVGVVGDVKVRDFLAPAEPAIYLPFAQQAYGSGAGLVVRVAGSPEASVPLLHRWLRAYEPYLAIVNAITYRDVVRGALYTQRMNAEMFSALAVLGLILAAIGIFSVVSLSVARRTREIGIRKAIGANRSEINAMVVRQALVPVLLGLVAGLAAALGASRLVESLLIGVRPTDPMAVMAGSMILLATAAVAAYLPARRAATVDPVRALKAE
jgi:putative ABC transport system permease protein